MNFRRAGVDDIGFLLPLMRDFYALERLPFDEQRSRALLGQLIADDGPGRLILFEDNSVLCGYMVLTFGFSLEFHGRDALIDELYVVPEFRSRGIGAAALQYAAELCRQTGIEAVHLEVDHVNNRVHELYRRLGFKDHDRHLMTLWL